MIYFKEFRVTGVANKETLDEGLASTTENPVRLLSILVGHSGDADNDVVGYQERELIFEIPDYLIETNESTGSTNTQRSFNRINEIEVGSDMPIGATFKVGIKCGATAKNIRGAYRYEIRPA